MRYKRADSRTSVQHLPPNALSRALSLFIAAVLVVVGLLVGLIALVVPRPPPESVPVPAPLGPPLTKHLAFIIVDGLRFDIATDPARMPLFAKRMREETSGEILSGRVSMTSSAVLTYATGQRGDVDQIINNESGSPVAYNHLIQNARKAGLVTAATGDWAWFRMFKGHWSMERPDPEGIAIDVDYNAEIFEAAHRFIKSSPRPNFAVFHFVTPDHQAHAYGVQSERYQRHIADFDQQLDALLRALPEDTTVVVTSDHGATDTGTHGTDTLIQRRSPIFAYGPGIAPGRKEPSPLDQVDIPSTFAALLGVSAPAHGRGHVLAGWLAISDEERARIACADLERLSAYARAHADNMAALEAATHACADPSPNARIERAANAARAIDQELGQAALGGRDFGWLIPILGVLAALALALFAIGKTSLPKPRESALGIAVFLALAAVSIALTFGLERLPGIAPNASRAALYVAVHLLLIAALWRARTSAAFLDRRPALGAALLPGLLVVTPPRTTQAESFVFSALFALAVLTVGLPSNDGISPGADRKRSWAASPIVVAGAFVALAVLAQVGFREAGFFPKDAYPYRLPIALASIAVLGVARAFAAAKQLALSPGGRANPSATAVPTRVWVLAIAGVVLAGSSLVLRRYAPASVCIAAWLGLPFLAAIAWRRRLQPLAELLAYSSYVWVSRDVEHPVVAITFLVASAVGDALRERHRDEPARPSIVLLIVTFLFAWGFLQRVGVQTGVDFTWFDWGAGAFRDRGASLARIGAALVYKHAFVRAAIVYAVLSALSPSLRAWTARGLLVAETLRTALLAVMLYVCGGSFWTALRVIGDLPHAITAASVAALSILATALTNGERDKPKNPLSSGASADFVPLAPPKPDPRSAPLRS